MSSRGLLLALVLMSPLVAPAAPARSDDLTVYRCVDARGKPTLRDSPCRSGERQETRQMLRPRDPPPAPRAVRAVPAPAPAAPATVRHVIAAAPRPLYECAAPDGRRYTSESPQGELRWQPAWIGVPLGGLHPPVRPAHAGIAYRDRHVDARIGTRWPVHPRPPRGIGYAPLGGAWVQDACVPLPPADACSRFSDRQAEIRRRYFQAMPSERAELDRESTVLEARIATECTR